ncbi:UNVERIFIED_ORG: type 1 fimbria pilin [Pseudomonas fluorescens]
MKVFATPLIGALLLCPTAFAASNTELLVQGIITPSACAPVVSGGGNVDFGKV